MLTNELTREMHAASLKAGAKRWLDPKQNRVASPHGCYAVRSKICAGTRDEVSELALAHVNSDETRAAFAGDELLSLRVWLMRDWARYCLSAPRPSAAETAASS